jgi:hypothetical protein
MNGDGGDLVNMETTIPIANNLKGTASSGRNFSVVRSIINRQLTAFYST